MRRVTKMLCAAAFLIGTAAAVATAQQPPGGDKKEPPKGDKGRGGFGGPGGRGFGGMPKPGQVMPDALREQLKLTDDQKKQMDDLQKEVDAKLDKILTDDQKKQLKEMRDRGPGGRGFGGPGGGKGARPMPPDGGGKPPADA